MKHCLKLLQLCVSTFCWYKVTGIANKRDINNFIFVFLSYVCLNAFAWVFRLVLFLLFQILFEVSPSLQTSSINSLTAASFFQYVAFLQLLLSCHRQFVQFRVDGFPVWEVPVRSRSYQIPDCAFFWTPGSPFILFVCSFLVRILWVCCRHFWNRLQCFYFGSSAKKPNLVCLFVDKSYVSAFIISLVWFGVVSLVEREW